MKKILLLPIKKLFLLILFASLIICYNNALAQNWQLIQPVYPNTSTFVAGFNVATYGASGDGTTDVTAIFQSRLNALSVLGGGTLFVPSGKYVIKGNLNIPKGITIRGEWKKPVKGEAIEGTILMAYAGRNDETAPAFITMEPSSGVIDLAIWYPEQKADNIVPYPQTILLGKPKYFGNDFCNVKNITLVNTYSGIIFSRINSGAAPVIENIYGTPLARGIEIDNLGDVGRIDWVDFSPDYWPESGLPNSPASAEIRSWIYQNGTGIVMRRNDWSYTNYVNIEGYNKGFHAAPSIASVGSSPNGHNYEMTFTNCKTGIYIDAVSNAGIMFTNINTINCETGVFVGAKVAGALQFQNANLDAGNAISVEAGSTTKLLLQQSKIKSGKVLINGSTFNASDCDFDNAAPQIAVGSDARILLTGNRFKNAKSIKNESLFVGIEDETPVIYKAIPSLPVMKNETHKPSVNVLYVVTQAPYNAIADGVTDNTNAIQSTLDAAGNAGGGIVFLPPGKYKVLGNLNIPSGVELKGSVDLGTSPTGPGSVLEVYAGKNMPGGEPFIKMQSNSGLRGVAFNYPEQMAALVPNFPAYPCLIQGRGNNIYIINVGMRATYYGIDLATYQCDNHYVDFIAGHIFAIGVKVGGGSQNGIIKNLQYNTINYSNGKETKFGVWPNSPDSGQNQPIYDYGYDHLESLTLQDVKNQILYNDFIFGSHKGIVLSSQNGKGPDGICLGLGIDGARKAMDIESTGTNGFDFIASQIVAFGKDATDTTTRYIVTGDNFNSNVTLHGGAFWGSPDKSIDLYGTGTVNLKNSHFQYSGRQEFARVNKTASLKIIGSAIAPTTFAKNNSEARISIQSSIVDSTGIRTVNTMLWKNNLGNNWDLLIHSDMDRRAWTASASVNNNAAKNVLDSIASTRWDTGGSQINGQYFIVDMKTVNTIYKIILDATVSPNDSPMGYEVYMSNDGTNWGSPLAIGSGTNGLTMISLDQKTGRYIKVVQTGTKTNYWSIHEFRVFGKIDVASVGLTPNQATINGNGTQQLAVTVLPQSAYNKNVLWVSSNPNVASVSNTGLVTSLSTGTTTITAIAEDNAEKKATAAITVTGLSAAVLVSSVTVQSPANSVPAGTNLQVTATIEPQNATNKQITWSSSDPTIATVDQNGLVKALSEGAVAITAKTIDGTKTSSINLTVTAPITVSGVSFDVSTLDIVVGSTKQLTPVISPVDAANKNITWTSDDPSIISVSETGVITALKAGNATITVKTVDGNHTASIAIVVKDVAITGITLSPVSTTMDIDSDKQLTLTVTPANANSQSVVWTSDNAAVASVGQNGLVTAHAVGVVVITASSPNESIKATSNITVISEMALSKGMIVYPNPVDNGMITIKLSESTSGPFQVRLSNILGQIVDSSTVEFINGKVTYTFKQKLSPGTYQLELSNRSLNFKEAKHLIVR